MILPRERIRRDRALHKLAIGAATVLYMLEHDNEFLIVIERHDRHGRRQYYQAKAQDVEAVTNGVR